jgi:hypothetical protein
VLLLLLLLLLSSLLQLVWPFRALVRVLLLVLCLDVNPNFD